MNIKIRKPDRIPVRIAQDAGMISLEELVFYAAMILYVIQTYIFHSEFEHVLGASVSKTLRMLCLFVCLAKILLAETNIAIRLVAVAGALGGFIMVIQKQADAGINLLMLVMLLLAAKDIPFRRLCKVMFWSCLACMLAVLAGFYEGTLYQPPMLEYQTRVREYLGFTYVSFGPIYFLNLLFCGLYAYTGRPTKENGGRCDEMPVRTWFILIGAAAWNYWFYKETDTTLIFLVGMLFILLYIVEIKLEIDFFRDNRFIRFLAAVVFPLLALFIYEVSVHFVPGNAFWERIDDLSHNRVGLNYEGLQKYGVHLFGQVIKQNTNTAKGEYFYIDSGYMKALLNYGFILFCVILLLYSVMFFAAVAERDIVLCMWLLCIACYAVINNNIISPVENASILAFWYCLDLLKWDREKKRRNIVSRNTKS